MNRPRLNASKDVMWDLIMNKKPQKRINKSTSNFNSVFSNNNNERKEHNQNNLPRPRL